MSDLAERILDAFPAGHYGLTALLRLLEVVETTEVPTAAVEVALQPRLKINPEFVAAQAETPEKLLMVVMHELHHVLLGHTRLFPRITIADNLVFDAVINAMLCRLFPQPEYVTFFTAINSHREFPACLLRPPEGWKPGNKVRLPPGLAGASSRTQWAYTALYSETGADYFDLFEALRGDLNAVGSPYSLIGNHEDTVVNTEACPGLFGAVREIVERWPQPPNPIGGRSFSRLVIGTFEKPKRIPSNREILRSLIRRIARLGSGSAVVPGWSDAESYSPIPALDRRSVVLTALGRPPLLYRREDRRRGRSGIDPVHVYVDVSGSIGSLKGALYGAVLDCREFVKPVIHLFSTFIADVSPRELRAGRCHTSGGTDIGCVAAHIAKHGVKRAVLLTDGFVGRAVGSHERALKGVRLGVALTPNYSTRTDLEPFVRHWAELHMEAS
jgi:hypothetical protein